MKQWECKRCKALIYEVPHDYDLHALVVEHNGQLYGDIIPATMEQMHEDHEALNNAACPLCDEWEDGNGKLVSMDSMTENSSRLSHEEIWDMVHRIVGDWPLVEVESIEPYFVESIQAVKFAVYDAIEDGTYNDTESLEDFLNENNIEWA